MPWPQSKAQPLDLHNPIKRTPPSPPPPGGKQHCLTSAIREPTEQYWRLEAAAATARTEKGVKSVKMTLYAFLCVFAPYFDNWGNVPKQNLWLAQVIQTLAN